MATQPDTLAQERARLQPYVDELMAILRQADPDATYTFGPGPDPGIWLLDVYLRPPLDEDLDLHATVTDRAVDFEIHDGVAIAVIPYARKEAVHSR